MATATVDRLADLAPGIAINNQTLAESPAQFGVAKAANGRYVDYLILVKTGFSGLELLKLLSKYSIHPDQEELYDPKADLENASRAIARPKTSTGRESWEAKINRYHQQDPDIRDSFNRFRADSERRWNRAIATSDIYPSYVIDMGVVPPDLSSLTADPMLGLLNWRHYIRGNRMRGLSRVEAFQAAADMGLGIQDDSDLFLGNSMLGIWTPGYVDSLPTHLRLAQGQRTQLRAALQGAFLASVDKYNRPLYRKRTSILPVLKEQINARVQTPHL